MNCGSVMKKKYNVTVVRHSVSSLDLEIEAKDMDEAEELALNQAKNHIFSKEDDYFLEVDCFEEIEGS